MRQFRSLFATVVTTLAIAASSLVAATPAHATGNVMHNWWNIRRNADSNRVLVLPANQAAWSSIKVTVKPSYLSTLTTGDAIEVTLEISGGYLRDWNTSASYTTPTPANGLSGANGVHSFKIGTEAFSSASVTFTGYLVPGDSGSVTINPVIYKNGVRSTDAITDDFSFAGSDFDAYASFTEYGATYTINQADYIIQAYSSICATLSSISAGQALTSTGTVSKDSNSNAGILVGSTYFYDGKTGTSNVSNPKPVNFLAGKIQQQIGVVSGDAGKVLSWNNDRSIKAAGTDVTGSCFDGAGTVTNSGFYTMVTNMDVYGAAANDWTRSISLDCDVVEQVSGRHVEVPRNIIMGGTTSQPCMTESAQIGKTYDVTYRVMASNGDMVIDEWSASWSPSAPADTTPPVLTGTGADAAKFESVDNSTSATQQGTLGAATSSDGRAGQLVVTRQNDTTLRISHWGQTGSINIGTGSYIDFAPPVSNAFTAGASDYYGPSRSRTAVSWYGNYDKWIYSQSDPDSFEFVIGTNNANTTSRVSMPFSAISDACAAIAGRGAVMMDTSDLDFSFVGAQTTKPLFKMQCGKPAVSGTTASIAMDGRAYIFELNISGSSATATALFAIDGVGEVNSANPTVYGEPNTFQCSLVASASSRKSNPSGTDPVLAFVTASRDVTSQGDCGFGGQAGTVQRVDTSLLLANGTVVQDSSPIAMTGKWADSMQAGSLAFDSLGNLNYLLTSTSDPSGSARDYTLYSVPTTGANRGKLTSAKSLTIDSHSDYVSNMANLSRVILANGVGNTDAIYALRSAWGASVGAATINLTSGNITSGQGISLQNSWVNYFVWQINAVNIVEGESSGAVNYYLRTTQTKYSVIHWMPGVDPALGPVVSSNSSFTVTSGTTSVGTLTSTAGTASWAITGGANSSLFNINASTGALTFKNAATPGTYTVEVTVTDTANGNKTATQTITITVPDTTAPTVTVNQTPTVSTTSTTVVTPSANESVTWAITGGAQQNDFNIDPSTGAVTFKNAMPAGTYTVEITATDGSGNTTSKTITVTVADGPDTTAPTVTVADTTPEVNPGDTSVADLDADENVTWSISGGANRALFQINSSTGALEFKQPAVPGTYTVIVTAEDAAGNKTNKTITVTVPAAPVAPTITTPTPIDVDEFGTGNLFDLTSNQTVDWEIIGGNGLMLTLDGNHVNYAGTVWNDADGTYIIVRATNPVTGLVTEKTIYLNVVPMALTTSGSVDPSGNGSYTVTASKDDFDESTMTLDDVSNPAVTNVQWVNGHLTFTVDPNYTGTVVFTFCAAPSEGCLSTKTVTLHLGAVSAPSTASRYVASGKSTKITWSAATNAASYVVKLNGKVICRTTATSCIYKKLIGPKQRVTLTAVGSNGTTATVTVGQDTSRFGLLSRLTNFSIYGTDLDWKKRYQLNQIAKAIKAAGFTSVKLIGNTDNIGTTKVDRALSLARAKAVKAYLSALLKGVKFTVVAAGRSNPIKSNAITINRKYNRRVDIYAA